MSIPLAPFLLFSIVSTIVIAKIRADARAAAKAGTVPLPNARLAGARPGFKQRIHQPGAYAYGMGTSALLSAITCGVLAFIHHRPTPPERRTYRIVDPFTNTVETRELTDQELREQYESVGDTLRRIRPGQDTRR